jgi:hypothetical protein
VPDGAVLTAATDPADAARPRDSRPALSSPERDALPVPRVAAAPAPPDRRDPTELIRIDKAVNDAMTSPHLAVQR